MTFPQISAAVGALVLAGMLLTGAGAAQSEGTAKITATVMDKGGAPLEGVDVNLDAVNMAEGNGMGTAENPSADKAAMRGALLQFKRITSAKSDKEGKVTFEKVRAGAYRVAVLYKPGGRTRAFASVQVKNGEAKAVTLKYKD